MGSEQVQVAIFGLGYAGIVHLAEMLVGRLLMIDSETLIEHIDLVITEHNSEEARAGCGHSRPHPAPRPGATTRCRRKSS